MIITVISAKDSGSDYCRGCLMDSWGSEFHIENVSTLESAADSVLYILEKNEKDVGKYEPIWNCAVIINGLTKCLVGDIDHDDENGYTEDSHNILHGEDNVYQKILNLAKKKLSDKRDEEKRLKSIENKKKRDARKAAKLKRENDKTKKEQELVDTLKKTLGVTQ